MAAEDGAFAFADVAPGPYKVRIDADGFFTVETPETVTANEATSITYRLAPARQSGTQYEFGATATIEAPPREVTKRSLSGEELVRMAGTRGDPLRAIEYMPGVGRSPGSPTSHHPRLVARGLRGVRSRARPSIASITSAA